MSSKEWNAGDKGREIVMIYVICIISIGVAIDTPLFLFSLFSSLTYIFIATFSLSKFHHKNAFF